MKKISEIIRLRFRNIEDPRLPVKSDVPNLHSLTLVEVLHVAGKNATGDAIVSGTFREIACWLHEMGYKPVLGLNGVWCQET